MKGTTFALRLELAETLGLMFTLPVRCDLVQKYDRERFANGSRVFSEESERSSCGPQDLKA